MSPRRRVKAGGITVRRLRQIAYHSSAGGRATEEPTMEKAQMSRREVLAVAAAGAASLAVASSGFAAAPRQEGPLKWGIIGTGTRGAFTHIPVLKEAPESEIVALCDVSEERLSSAAAKVPHPTAQYTDYQKLLTDPNVNAIVI